MSVAFSETPTVTKATTTQPPDTLPTRQRRRRVILLPCSLLLVSEVSQLVPLSATNSVGLLHIYTNTSHYSTNMYQPTTAMTRTTPLPLPQRLLPLLLHHMAPTHMVPTPTVLHPHRIPIRMPRPLKSLLQCPLTTRMATPSQVVTVSRWRRSAKSSSRRRKSIKRNLRTTTRTRSETRCDFHDSAKWFAPAESLLCISLLFNWQLTKITRSIVFFNEGKKKKHPANLRISRLHPARKRWEKK